jgi:hypothetical protein
VRVSSEGHAQPVSQWWWWSDVDRRVGCSGWVVSGPGPGTDDRPTVVAECERAIRTQETVQDCHEKRVSGGRRQRPGEQVGEGSVSL